jgi:DNA-binding NtrC family response regulator
MSDDETRTALRAPPRRGPTAVGLVVEAGPDAGRRAALGGDATRLLVGTGPACGLLLSDPTVSRRHLVVDVTGGDIRVTDQQSYNGTFLGGARILDAFAQVNDVVALGATRLRVVALDPPAGRAASAARASFGRMKGASPAMQRVYPLAERLAQSDVPVIIEGETGTGKEVLAEALHEMGRRKDGPFVVFDCMTTPPSLLEATLFGHEKGAFTGAAAASRGVFEQAHGGTLFVDEIGDLALELQPKLLRAIQRGEVRRLGGERQLKVDVRVVAATRRDLDREVAAGRFRDDLFFRLAVGRIELPPLRARRGDVGLLARCFWDALGGAALRVPIDTFERWEREPWPGNVRELENAVARLLALGDLTDAAWPPTAPRRPDAATDPMGEVLAMKLPFPVARQRVLERFERAYVEQALRDHDGNMTRAASASGIARRYLHMIRARHREGDEQP